jgi:hypothetical protein
MELNFLMVYFLCVKDYFVSSHRSCAVESPQRGQAPRNSPVDCFSEEPGGVLAHREDLQRKA